MKLYQLSLLLILFLYACSNQGLSPKEAAQQTCKCMKLSKDTSEEGVKAFTDCNANTREMMADYREDEEWMNQWKEELMKTLKDCMSE